MTKAVVNLDFNSDERTIIEWKTLHWAGRKGIFYFGTFSVGTLSFKRSLYA